MFEAWISSPQDEGWSVSASEVSKLKSNLAQTQVSKSADEKDLQDTHIPSFLEDFCVIHGGTSIW